MSRDGFVLSWNGRHSGHSRTMKKGDVICPQCNVGFRRIELASRSGSAGEFRCPLCDQVLEVFDGSSEIVYRITVAPEKLFE
jgi:transposase-like protein